MHSILRQQEAQFVAVGGLCIDFSNPCNYMYYAVGVKRVGYLSRE